MDRALRLWDDPTQASTLSFRPQLCASLGPQLVLAGYHQGDHRIWLYDNSTQSYARRYLQLRYKMAPSLISAGRTLQSAGFPLTARCDLVFPEYAEAKDPTQYLHLNSSLVAPLDENASTRQVWIPP